MSRDIATLSWQNTRSHGTCTFSNRPAASFSSNRDASGLSNSLTAYFSYGFLDQMLTPGALSGTAQVMDSFSAPGATGCRLPHQVSWQKAVAVPSIFKPLMVTPESS